MTACVESPWSSLASTLGKQGKLSYTFEVAHVSEEDLDDCTTFDGRQRVNLRILLCCWSVKLSSQLLNSRSDLDIFVDKGIGPEDRFIQSVNERLSRHKFTGALFLLYERKRIGGAGYEITNSMLNFIFAVWCISVAYMVFILP